MTFDVSPINDLFRSIEEKDIILLRECLERGDDVNQRDERELIGNGNTPLIDAANGGFPEAVIELVRCGAEVDKSCFSGWTPLIRAANSGHLDCVRILLEAGASVNLRNNEGYSAHGRVMRSDRDICDLLLAFGAE